MPEKSYYNRLYAFQDEIMKIIHSQGVDFYLTGGTALSRCYFNHRYSDDLDFFINRAPDFKKQAQRVVTALRRDNLRIEIGTASESFFRITVLKDKMQLFDSIKWIISVDQKALDKERLQMHDDIFYGRSNSLVG